MRTYMPAKLNLAKRQALIQNQTSYMYSSSSPTLIPEVVQQFPRRKSLRDIKKILSRKLIKCFECHEEYLSHYCIDKSCPNPKLVCVFCGIESPASSHYGHKAAYVQPLLLKEVTASQDDLIRKTTQYRDLIVSEITKFQQYFDQLKEITKIVQDFVKEEKQKKEIYGLNGFKQRIQSLLSDERKDLTLQYVFKDVRFFSNEDSQRSFQTLKACIISKINQLSVLPNPQKVMKDTLLSIGQTFTKFDPIVPVQKQIQVTDRADSPWRLYCDLFTDNLKHNPLLIKIQSDTAGRTRVHEHFYHNFNQCRRVTVQNCSMSSLVFPLVQFDNLIQLDFTSSYDSSVQSIKFETIPPTGIQSLALRNMREEDYRVMERVKTLCPNLLQLNLQLNNKTDPASCIPLKCLLSTQFPGLRRFHLKVRKEQDIRNANSNYMKYYHPAENSNLEQLIQKFIMNHPLLSRFRVEGLKLKNNLETITALSCNLGFTLEFSYKGDSNPVSIFPGNRFLQIRRSELLTQRRRLMGMLQQMYKKKMLRDRPDIVNQLIETIQGLD